MPKNIEIIELRLGINIADEIRKKTEAMAKIDIGLIPKHTKQDPWVEKCELISTLLFAAEDGGVSKSKICELIDIKDSQLSTFAGKLRNYLRTNHNANLVKLGTGTKVVYIARKQESLQDRTTNQPRLDHETVDLADLIQESSDSEL